MTAKFFLLVVLVLTCEFTRAQKKKLLKPTLITLDFLDFEKSKLKYSAPIGSPVILQIKNLNRNIYTCQVNGSQNNYFTTAPQIFSPLTNPPSKVIDKKIEPQNSGASFASPSMFDPLSSEIQLLSANQIDFEKAFKEFSIRFEEYKKSYATIQSSILLKNVLNTLIQDCSTDIDDLTKLAVVEAKKFIVLNKTGSETDAENILILKAQVQNIIDINLKRLADFFDKLKKLQSSLQDKGEAINTSSNLLSKKIDEKLITKLPNDQKNSIEAKKIIAGKIPITIKKDVDQINDIMEDVKDAQTYKDNYIQTNQAGEITLLCSKFTAGYFTLQTAEILEKDELLFDITIQPKADAQCGNTSLHLPVRIRASGGFKIDFSTGLFLNFGNKDFLDQTYRLDTVTGQPDKYKVTKNTNRSKVIPSVGAFLHAYIRTGGNIQPALALGLSLSAGQTARLNYHFGGSVILGKEQRFIISGGFTLVQASILDGKYSEGQYILKTSAPESIPTTSYYRWGHFLSLNYNLTR